MRRLTVLYDPSCDFCRRCRRWLETEPALVELEFLGRADPAAEERFGRIEAAPDELVVVSDEGALYRGPNAFIVCLYALRDYRAWAFRLAAPELQPLARRALDWLSHNRLRLGRWLPGSDDEAFATALAGTGEPACAGEGCRAPDGGNPVRALTWRSVAMLLVKNVSVCVGLGAMVASAVLFLVDDQIKAFELPVMTLLALVITVPFGTVAGVVGTAVIAALKSSERSPGTGARWMGLGATTGLVVGAAIPILLGAAGTSRVTPEWLAATAIAGAACGLVMGRLGWNDLERSRGRRGPVSPGASP